MNVDSSVSRSTVRSASKLLLAAAGLVVLLSLVSLLPGVERVVPATPVTVAAVASAVVTVALVALLLAVAPALASLVRGTVDGPHRVVENAASVVYWLVVLAALLVAHGGLVRLAVPLFEEAMWLYDVAFLVAALLPVAAIAARLYDTLEPGADLVTDAVLEGGTSDEASATPGRPDDGDR